MRIQMNLTLFSINVVLIRMLSVLSVISAGGFPKGFLNDITESDTVKNRLTSRWKWEVWDVVPGTHVFKIYIFNVTNPSDVEKGLRPILAEVGPYAYVEHRIKFNVSINLDLSVNFERNFTYMFDPRQSNGTESDLVNILNIPFVIFSTIASRRGNIGDTAVKKLVNENGESLIKRHVKVGDLLFNGIDVNAYKRYTEILGDDNSVLRDEFNSGTYGVFKLKSGAHEGIFTVQSGLKDLSQFGKIVKLNHELNLNYWYGDGCNMINGTDGSVFPPYVDKDSILEIFDDDLCRSISFSYKKSIEYFNSVINAFRFSLRNHTLADPRKYPSNTCFCKNPGMQADNCLKAGVLDVSSCREGAPYVLSYPHFLDASPEYGQSVVGLSPNPDKHDTHIDIEPRIGAVIQYNRRLQWNLRLQPLQNIDYFSNIRTLLFPILWNDDKFKLDDDKRDLLVSEIANLNGFNSTGSLLKSSFFILMIIVSGCVYNLRIF